MYGSLYGEPIEAVVADENEPVASFGIRVRNATSVFEECFDSNYYTNKYGIHYRAQAFKRGERVY